MQILFWILSTKFFLKFLLLAREELFEILIKD